MDSRQAGLVARRHPSPIREWVELLELELELELLLLLEDAIRGAKPVTAAAHDERAGQQCVQCSGAQLPWRRAAQCARGWCDRCGARGLLRVSYGCNGLARGPAGIWASGMYDTRDA